MSLDFRPRSGQHRVEQLGGTFFVGHVVTFRLA
jgi:hypothetical protein